MSELSVLSREPSTAAEPSGHTTGDAPPSPPSPGLLGGSTDGDSPGSDGGGCGDLLLPGRGLHSSGSAGEGSGRGGRGGGGGGFGGGSPPEFF